MKYTTKEALEQIMSRRERIVRQRDRRISRILSGTAGVMFAALVLEIALLPGKPGVESSGSVYGSFILSPEAGGYVLAAVIAFALGVCVTLLCLHRRKKKPTDQISQKQYEEESEK